MTMTAPSPAQHSVMVFKESAPASPEIKSMSCCMIHEIIRFSVPESKAENTATDSAKRFFR